MLGHGGVSGGLPGCLHEFLLTALSVVRMLVSARLGGSSVVCVGSGGDK